LGPRLTRSESSSFSHERPKQSVSQETPEEASPWRVPPEEKIQSQVVQSQVLQGAVHQVGAVFLPELDLIGHVSK
jgi:hypothetical protein